MLMRILTTRDFWSGALFIVMGTSALVLGHDLRAGTAARMGPGYVPHAIGWILIALGTAIAFKSCFAGAERIGAFHLRPVILIVLSVVAFALLLQPAGLLPAMLALIALAVPAGREARFREAVGIAVFLALLCTGIFKIGLEMSFPVIAGVW
jgi:hypothetical protein